MIFNLLPKTKIAWSDVWIGAALTSSLGSTSGRVWRLPLTGPPALWWWSSHGSITPHCSCILARNSRETQPMMDVRLAAQGKPAVEAFFREHGISSDYFPRIASRSSRIRRRKKYHNQGREHSRGIAMPDIWGQLAHRKTSRSAAASCP